MQSKEECQKKLELLWRFMICQIHLILNGYLQQQICNLNPLLLFQAYAFQNIRAGLISSRRLYWRTWIEILMSIGLSRHLTFPDVFWKLDMMCLITACQRYSFCVILMLVIRTSDFAVKGSSAIGRSMPDLLSGSVLPLPLPFPSPSRVYYRCTRTPGEKDSELWDNLIDKSK